MSLDSLRDFASAHSETALAVGGLAIGFAFGALVFRTNFCAMGSLSDIRNFGDHRRFRAWLLAAAVALAGAQLLAHFGVVALEKSMYLAPTINWAGYIAGGLIFGAGMVFAGGCPSRNLARAGGGDLRSLLTLLIVGLTAYMTIGGLLAYPRSWLEQATAVSLGKLTTQSLGDILGAAGLPAASATITVLLVLATLAYCFSDARFRASRVHVLSGLGVGLLVIAGWALTGLAYDDMATRPAAPISLTYIRPTGDTLEWLQRFTAAPVPGFGVASVVGALLGAFVAARLMGRFRIVSFADKGDTLRSLGGAALMGIGGVMALGCTIGQAVTGVSTLAAGSFITFAAIVTGGYWALGVLERRIMAG